MAPIFSSLVLAAPLMASLAPFAAAAPNKGRLWKHPLSVTTLTGQGAAATAAVGEAVSEEKRWMVHADGVEYMDALPAGFKLPPGVTLPPEYGPVTLNIAPTTSAPAAQETEMQGDVPIMRRFDCSMDGSDGSKDVECMGLLPVGGNQPNGAPVQITGAGGLFREHNLAAPSTMASSTSVVASTFTTMAKVEPRGTTLTIPTLTITADVDSLMSTSTSNVPSPTRVVPRGDLSGLDLTRFSHRLIHDPVFTRSTTSASMTTTITAATITITASAADGEADLPAGLGPKLLAERKVPVFKVHDRLLPLGPGPVKAADDEADLPAGLGPKSLAERKVPVFKVHDRLLPLGPGPVIASSMPDVVSTAPVSSREITTDEYPACVKTASCKRTETSSSVVEASLPAEEAEVARHWNPFKGWKLFPRKSTADRTPTDKELRTASFWSSIIPRCDFCSRKGLAASSPASLPETKEAAPIPATLDAEMAAYVACAETGTCVEEPETLRNQIWGNENGGSGESEHQKRTDETSSTQSPATLPTPATHDLKVDAYTNCLKDGTCFDAEEVRALRLDAQCFRGEACNISLEEARAIRLGAKCHRGEPCNLPPPPKKLTRAISPLAGRRRKGQRPTERCLPNSLLVCEDGDPKSDTCKCEYNEDDGCAEGARKLCSGPWPEDCDCVWKDLSLYPDDD